MGINMKNILFVGPFPPHQRGGGEYVAHSIAKAMKKKGFKIFVLFMGKDKFFERYDDRGTKVYRVDKFYKGRKERFSLLQILRYFTIELFNPFAFLFTIYMILRYKIHVVHISTFHQISVSPLIAAKLLWRKTILTFHSHELFCFISSLSPNCPGAEKHKCGKCILNSQALPDFLKRHEFAYNKALQISNHLIKSTLFFKSKMAQLANLAIFPSEYLKNYYVKHGFDSSKSMVIYNFLDNPKGRKKNMIKLKSKFGIKNEKVILFVGHMIAMKGPQILLDAFNLLKNKKNLKLMFVGYGPLIEELKQKALKLKLDKEIIFTGWIPREDLMSVYNLADVVVIPSIFPETFSLIFLEAFNAKKIVIASNIGALSDNIINGETGFLVKPNDPKELSKNLEFVVTNLRKLEPMKKRVYEEATTKYDPRIFIKEYERLYA